MVKILLRRDVTSLYQAPKIGGFTSFDGYDYDDFGIF
jgi:hypothetical protein